MDFPTDRRLGSGNMEAGATPEHHFDDRHGHFLGIVPVKFIHLLDNHADGLGAPFIVQCSGNYPGVFPAGGYLKIRQVAYSLDIADFDLLGQIFPLVSIPDRGLDPRQGW
jgi:hypothetical protein